MRKIRGFFISQTAFSRSPLTSHYSLLSAHRSLLISPLRVTPCPPWLILLPVLLLSCQSAPKVTDFALMETNGVPLDPGASVYVLADAKQARPVLDILPFEELKDKQTRQMLDKTDFIAAALFPKESGRRFQIAAWGSYPSSGAAMAFNMNKNWKKQRSAAGYSWWYSRANGLSIALSPKQAFAAASTDNAPIDPVTAAPGVEMPEGFGEFRKAASGSLSAILSCWFDNPSLVINRILSTGGIPINVPAEKLFIVLFPAEEDRYEAAIRIQFESVSQARGIAAIFAIAINFLPDESDSSLAAIFFANPPVQNGRSLDIKTGVLSKTEIAQLFSFFMEN